MSFQSSKRMCVPCGRELRICRNGVLVQETAGEEGREHLYKLWETDVWECPQCGMQIAVIGRQQGPLCHGFEKEKVERNLAINEEQVDEGKAVEPICCWEYDTDRRNPRVPRPMPRIARPVPPPYDDDRYEDLVEDERRLQRALRD